MINDLRALMTALGVNQAGYAELTGQLQPNVSRALRTGNAPAETKALRRALVNLAEQGADIRAAFEGGRG